VVNKFSAVHKDKMIKFEGFMTVGIEKNFYENGEKSTEEIINLIKEELKMLS